MTKNLTEHAQECNPSIKRSKLDRSNARRASVVQVTIVARIEVIRLFLAAASKKDFVVYQMDVKSAFLYGKIKEEVYVCQPLGFEDPDFPHIVYKVEKALCVHQAPRAWYETLSTYLLDNGFQRGQIDKTLFIKRVKESLDTSKVQPKLSLWYPKDSPFDLEAYNDSDYACASLDRKSTTGGCQFLGSRLILWKCKKQTVVENSTTEAEYLAASNCCGQVLWIQNQLLDYGYNFMNTKIFIDNESTIIIIKNLVFHSKTKNIKIRHHFIRDSYEKRLIQVIKIHTDHNVADLLTKAFDVSLPTVPSSSQPQKTKKHRKTKRKATEISQSSGPTTLVADETVYEEKGDSVERVATTAASLDVEQDSGSGPKSQGTILGDRPAQTRFERLSKQSNDLPLSRVNTPGTGEDILKIMELMEICTKFFDRVLALENVKTAQDLEINSLKKRVKKLEKKKKARTLQLKRRLFKVRIESSAKKSLGDQEDASKQGRNEDQDDDISCAPIITAGVSVSSAEPSTLHVIEDEDLTIAQTLMKMRTMMEADYELAQRLQAEEHGELTIEERSRLFVELMDKRKKHFAKLRAEKIRRKPPTKAQKRNQMSTYLRNMAGYKHTQLKNKSFEEIQMLFDKEIKRVNLFVPMDLEVVEGSGKKTESSRKETVSKKGAGEELDEESLKRQKLEDDAEKAELQLCLEVVPKDGEAVNVESLSTKYPIVDWKTHILPEDKIFIQARCVRFILADTGITIHILVERKYPLTQEMLSRMLSRRLEVDHECEMAYELLRFTRSQLKK
ncbi:putative ribonuclease H-like domain-containing protein [Tanacetum coccineum]